MISAVTLRPEVDFSSEPSPASKTSSRLIESPVSPASFSTTILSPGATRYCLPPVRTTANIGLSLLHLKNDPREERQRAQPSRGKRAAYGRGARVSTSALAD